MTSLAESFEPRRNALNAVRLALAVGVIGWHSFPLTGQEVRSEPVRQLLGNVFVDGFFAISGFLILSSWIRNPRWWPYLRARVLRILPAYWVCLIITGAIFSPVSVWIRGQQWTSSIAQSGFSYVLQNSLLKIRQYGIEGTLTDIPYPNVWNGSLWTLWWEFLCYLGILALGVLKLLRFRAVLPCSFIACVAAMVAVTVSPTTNNFINTAPRFATMFLAGALIYSWQSRLPVSWRLVSVAFAMVLVSTLVPNYRVLAALPLAYATICSGALIKLRWLRLRNDVSYGVYIYAFPMQQLLSSAGAYKFGVLAFFVISTLSALPPAIISWFAVERPALRLKAGSAFAESSKVAKARSNQIEPVD